ncbi:type II toxin-antitoxin system mRNA interferase toxin, RelE/StbE family [Helicobacter saguini]|uniref:Type II toxin-antitoxin system YafQ family toxin n=1 Tax=Helicobacter saguini TaxID=1548018 RepID=A0A099B628_9HELI|nr:type II toxin-antitoxin system YafQ family toxin [Helicobacter saguini]MWV61004.1 type II toxin-antitoxin system mRNA interferase toxin, RelE/StbE family [Helicobacter saguini]MWV68327.1 type II toxin-antitoxin system mRNA interferase toxin, RelE/StbE family [Helicobacter saguini]MWV70208.1 type II toxin-antitoxin system mRNA interferase toxin, RelE/StbE family [Helicobacter saguini]MWV72111.1 type II toxin-antitoxin system mRNA interferase toxin, RelE/StbE family [Helicobacter saguini]TLD9
MAKYKISYRKAFRKNFKKLSKENKNLANEVINKIANGEVLDSSYNNHKLKGDLQDFMECHIKPDLLLIYKKFDDILVLVCVNIGSHSDLF